MRLKLAQTWSNLKGPSSAETNLSIQIYFRERARRGDSAGMLRKMPA
jgi:hypothetical protein